MGKRFHAQRFRDGELGPQVRSHSCSASEPESANICSLVGSRRGHRGSVLCQILELPNVGKAQHPLRVQRGQSHRQVQVPVPVAFVPLVLGHCWLPSLPGLTAVPTVWGGGH